MYNTLVKKNKFLNAYTHSIKILGPSYIWYNKRGLTSQHLPTKHMRTHKNNDEGYNRVNC